MEQFAEDAELIGTLRDKRNCSCQFLHTIEEESDDSSEDAPYLELNSMVKEIYTDADVRLGRGAEA